MSSKDCIQKLSRVLFWDMDIDTADMDKYPAHSHTKEEDYRCYHFRQLFQTPWNS